MSAQHKKPILYYAYDPLCGWCYGFSPVINNIASKYGEDFEIKVIPGGMVLGERVGPISEVAPYIKDAYKRVEDMTGVKFGQPYLDDLLHGGNTIMNSWPGCLATTVFNELAAEHAVAFASAIQGAIYKDGVSPEDIDHFIQLAGEYQIDIEKFRVMTKEKEWHERTLDNFKLSSELGVTGFPTIVLEKNDERTVLVRGYASQSRIEEQLNDYLTKD